MGDDDVFEFLDSVTAALVFGDRQAPPEPEPEPEAPAAGKRAPAVSPDWLKRMRLAEAAQETVIVKEAGRALKPGFLKLGNVGRLNTKHRHREAVSALGFRQAAGETLGWSLGADKRVNIYGMKDKTVTTTELADVSHKLVHGVLSTADNRRLICCSDRANIYGFDLETQGLIKYPYVGKRGDQFFFTQCLSHQGSLFLLDDRGNIYQVDERTQRLARKITSGTDLVSITVVPDKEVLMGVNKSGEVFEWEFDHNTRRCLSRRRLPGAVGVNAMACDGTSVWAADSSGVVTQHAAGDLALLKSFSNLAGPATILTCSKSLCLAANGEKADNAKLFNTEQRYTYQNWPGDKLNAGVITAAAICDDWIGLGLDDGIVKVWGIAG